MKECNGSRFEILSETGDDGPVLRERDSKEALMDKINAIPSPSHGLVFKSPERAFGQTKGKENQSSSCRKLEQKRSLKTVTVNLPRQSQSLGGQRVSIP